MINIIGVRFRPAGKIYYFEPTDETFPVGSHVIVETARGVEAGRVVFPTRRIEDSEVHKPVRKVIRKATAEDEERIRSNERAAKRAFATCKERIRKHNLEMKLIHAEYTFDNKKILFYFTADGRVDFRELIKDLAGTFRTRIELRQIGVRDESKLLGGLGICGRPLCCASYLSDFAPVSIKMAKEQSLSLNPTKISGVCGRLMCCLKNEEETYEYLNKNLPRPGDIVRTPEGISGEVQQSNILRQTVRLLVQDGDQIEAADYPADELTILERHKKGKPRRKLATLLHAQKEEKAAAVRERINERQKAVQEAREKQLHRDDRENGGRREKGRRGAAPEEKGEFRKARQSSRTEARKNTDQQEQRRSGEQREGRRSRRRPDRRRDKAQTGRNSGQKEKKSDRTETE